MTAEDLCLLLVVISTISSKIQALPVGSTEGSLWCPPCELESELTDGQMEQAEICLGQIDDALNPFSGISRTQLPVVSLDDEQKRYVADKFGVMFSSDPPEEEDDADDTHTRNFHRGKRQGSPFHYRICPPDGLSYRDLELGVNASGSPVQIIQLGDMKQWFLEEQCESSTPALPPTGHNDVICMEITRTTTAVVINLENPDMGIHLEQILVQSCASFKQFD